MVLKSHPCIYFTEREYSEGLLEGIDQYHFFDEVIVPGIEEELLEGNASP
jgi:hypothetical protein